MKPKKGKVPVHPDGQSWSRVDLVLVRPGPGASLVQSAVEKASMMLVEFLISFKS